MKDSYIFELISLKKNEFLEYLGVQGQRERKAKRGKERERDHYLGSEGQSEQEESHKVGQFDEVLLAVHESRETVAQAGQDGFTTGKLNRKIMIDT